MYVDLESLNIIRFEFPKLTTNKFSKSSLKIFRNFESTLVYQKGNFLTLSIYNFTDIESQHNLLGT